ncbi:hypothetical protein [Bosea sp. (in: a-proteobacteria)]|uniref:hypothetical protein n=1 Tax=Bosea sp. (in: a-proteobacteria) TaxID=1871050 RepID=UPI003B3A1031
MIRSSLTSLAGIAVARAVEKGSIPTALSVPLTVMIARLPFPALLLGAAGYGAYKLATGSKRGKASSARSGASRNARAVAKG